MVQIGLNWFQLVSIGLNHFRLVSTGFIRSHGVCEQLFSFNIFNWFHLDSVDSTCSQLVSTGFNWFQLVSIGYKICHSKVSDMWNVVDFITNSLYVATIGLRLRAYYDVRNIVVMILVNQMIIN